MGELSVGSNFLGKFPFSEDVFPCGMVLYMGVRVGYFPCVGIFSVFLLRVGRDKRLEPMSIYFRAKVINVMSSLFD